MAATMPPISASKLDPHVYTALPIAAARAVDYRRPGGPLINDPLAKKLLMGEHHLERSAAVDYMTMRALIGDELCREAYYDSTHPVRQIVVLGAGMDSRAFRLGLTEAVFFEVDKQDLFTAKEPLVDDVPLQCRAREKIVGTIGAYDSKEGPFYLKDALEKHGFDKTKPTIWLLEGLVPYIETDRLRKVAKEIGDLSAVGSGFWMDGFSKTSVHGGAPMIFHNVPFVSGMDDYDELFMNAGFDEAEAYDMGGVQIDESDQYSPTIYYDRRYRIYAPGKRMYTSAGRRMCVMAKGWKTRPTSGTLGRSPYYHPM